MKWNQAVCILIAAATSAVARDASACSNTCTNITTPCSFGQYSGQQLDTTASIDADCSVVDGQQFHIEIHAGGNSGTETTRWLDSGHTLQYQVYQDAARTQYWGTAASSAALYFTPSVGHNIKTVYCRIFANQTPVNGSYSDSTNSHIYSNDGCNNINTALAETATVNGLCSTSVTTNLSFGAYDPIVTNKSSALDGTAALSVNCTNTVPYTITLGQGSNAGGGSTDAAPLRRMAAGADMLSYSLYQNSGRTTVWGNTSGTGVAGTGTGSAQSLTVYGRAPSGQNAGTGSHSDTVLVTLTF